jgi:hypothetical protein
MKLTDNFNLRINYVLVGYAANNSGVFKKVKDQFDAWKSMGVQSKLFVVTDVASAEKWRSVDPNAKILVDTSIFRKAINRIKIVKMAQQTRPDIVYIRDAFPLRIPRSNSDVCLEVQSLYGRELLIRSRFKYLVFKISTQFTYRYVNAAVYVSNELMKANEVKCAKSINKIVIANGINLERIDSLPPSLNLNPAVFFVGHPGQEWHGISDLIEFARFNQDLDFHIVGYEDNFRLQNVYSYGLLSYADYKDIAEKCSVGIGSLRLDVNGMSEASPLKTREYLAMGLPVITRYMDTDFAECPDFILRLPQNGLPINDHSIEIRKFIEFWRGKRVSRDQITRLDVNEKEKTRLGFLRDVIR